MKKTTQRSKTSTIPNGISVWVIEDNEGFRDNLCKLINSAKGMFCRSTFRTCEEALQKLTTDFCPEIILLDLGLPGMSGLEGIPTIKAISPATQIIVITVYDDFDKVLNAICGGAVGYLLKASSEEKIIEAIHDVRAGGSSINPHIARKILTVFSEKKTPANSFSLTVREQEILQWMIQGHTKKHIAEEVHLSYHTIDTHIRNIYYKLQVHTRSEAVAKALKNGM